MAYVVTTVRIDEDKRAELKNRGISLTKLVDDALDSILELHLEDKKTLEDQKEKLNEDIKNLEYSKDLAVQRVNTEYERELTTLQLTREDNLRKVNTDFNRQIESLKFKTRQLDDLIVKADLRAKRNAELKEAEAKAEILSEAYEIYVKYDGAVSTKAEVKEAITSASKDTGIAFETIVNNFYEKAKKENKIL